MQNGAMAMAFSAGDKLKSSARDFLKNLEAWKAQQEEMPTSFESAISKMFGSCTVGAGGTATTTAGVEFHFGHDHPDRTSESSSQRKPVVTPETLRTSRPLRPELGEQVYENLFMDDQIHQQSQHEQSQSQGRQIPVPPPPPRRNISPQRYSPPIPRSADSARESAEPTRESHSNNQTQHQKRSQQTHRLTVDTYFQNTVETKTNTPLVFPVSSPQKITIIPANMAQSPESVPRTITPLGSNHLIVPNRTFDDNISAVSAYTLEAMAQADKLKYSPSNDSSLFPSSRDSRQPPSPASKDRLLPKKKDLIAPSPPNWNFNRKRSEQTQDTRNTRTSETTGDSSGHSKWVNEEQNFWEQEAMVSSSQFPGVHKSNPSRAKSQTSRKTNDYTVSTSSSSQSSFAHPHDTIHFDPADFLPPPPPSAASCSYHNSHDELLGDTAFSRDPNRIDQVLLLPVDTEMAEI